jgi:hypothetical protein
MQDALLVEVSVTQRIYTNAFLPKECQDADEILRRIDGVLDPRSGWAHISFLQSNQSRSIGDLIAEYRAVGEYSGSFAQWLVENLVTAHVQVFEMPKMGELRHEIALLRDENALLLQKLSSILRIAMLD